MSNASETANIKHGASKNEAPVQIDQIINHPLFSTVLGTHLFQHTNLAPPGQSDPDQQGEQILDEDSKEKHDAEQVRLMRMIAQRKENERRNIDNLLTDPNSLVNVVAEQYYANQKFGKKNSPFTGMEEDFSSETSEAITEFLIKQSSLHILQKVELDMMHTALDEYIENMHSALQILPTDVESLNKQQQLLMTEATSPSSPTLDPRTIQQIQQHHAATGSLPTSSDHFNDPSSPFPGPPIPPATFAGKKQEEVITELKRKYSGQVLQVAQSKKKKKNFQKDTSELLNNWFFSNLHDPYPSDEVKKQLAAQTNLSLSQVNNWFGNKRIRYKRKMLEKSRRVAAGQGVEVSSPEMHTPTRSRKRRSNRADSVDSSGGDGTPVTPQHMYQQQAGNHFYGGPPRIPPPMNSIFVNPPQQMSVEAYQHQQQQMHARGQHSMGYPQYFNE
jgi:hypothetical protein